MSSYKRQIIFIPGIMGSRLMDRKLVIWPQIIRNRLNNKFYDRLKDMDNLNIMPKGSIYWIYHKIESKLSSHDFCDKFSVFSYDWRKNNIIHINNLEKLIIDDVDEVIIVAHSMGGLIAKLFLNLCKNKEKLEKVKKLITLGTPWNGSPESYLSFKFGTKIAGVITNEQSREIVPYFPSTYQLLPNEEYITKHNQNNNCAYKIDNVPLDWNKVSNKYFELLSTYGYEYKKILKEYYDALRVNISIEHHEIIGFSIPTVTSIIENFALKTQIQFGKGDGTVPILSAVSNTQNKYFIKENHQGLVKNEIALNLLGNIVNNKKEYISEEIYTYEQVNAMTFDYDVIKVACPVIVSLSDADNRIVYGDIGLMAEEDIAKMVMEQNKDVLSIGDSTYFIFRKDKKNNRIHIEAYEEGPVSISIEKYRKDKLENTGVFKTFILNEETNADLIVMKDTFESELHIERNDKITDISRPIIIEKENKKHDEVIPELAYKLLGDKINHRNKNNENYYIASDKVEFLVNETIKDNNEILEILYSVNNDVFIPIELNNPKVLCLKKGKNTLRFFYRNITGNNGKIHKEEIYYIDEMNPKIIIKFNPEQYRIICEFKYDDDIESLSHIQPKVSIEYNNNAGVILNHIKYKNIIRNITVNCTDFFGDITSYEFSINESLILSIINGDNNPDKLNKFLETLNINTSYDKVYLRKNTGGTARKLTADNIHNAREIIVKGKNIELEIQKDYKFEIAFRNLIEDIKFNELTNYEFRFIIRDLYTNDEIPDMDINVFIGQQSENIPYIKVYLLNTFYDKNNGIYVSIIDTKELQLTLKENLILGEKELKKMYLIIENKKDEDKILRIHPITLSY